MLSDVTVREGLALLKRAGKRDWKVAILTDSNSAADNIIQIVAMKKPQMMFYLPSMRITIKTISEKKIGLLSWAIRIGETGQIRNAGDSEWKSIDEPGIHCGTSAYGSL